MHACSGEGSALKCINLEWLLTAHGSQTSTWNRIIFCRERAESPIIMAVK